MRPFASGPFDDHPRRLLTRTRRAVLQVLAAAKHPVSVRELRAATGAMDLETVYHMLPWLVKTCLAREVAAGPGSERSKLVGAR